MQHICGILYLPMKLVLVFRVLLAKPRVIDGTYPRKALDRSDNVRISASKARLSALIAGALSGGGRIRPVNPAASLALK